MNATMTTPKLDDIVTVERQPGGCWLVRLAAGDKPATIGCLYADGTGGWLAFANEPEKAHRPPVREAGDNRMSPSWTTRSEALAALVRRHIARSLGLIR
jgi:hypothetical protein